MGHYLFLVTTTKENAETSEQARSYVVDFLLSEGFTAGGRYSYPRSDWFVIGGRWTGWLSRHSWAQDYYAYQEKRERKSGVAVGSQFDPDDVRALTRGELILELGRTWRAMAPAEYQDIPVDRSRYKELGYADDAMIVTEELYNTLLARYEAVPDGECFDDLEDEPPTRDFVGTKWLVVVDYHC